MSEIKKARARYTEEISAIVEFNSEDKLSMKERTELVVSFLEKNPTIWINVNHAPTDYVVEIVKKASPDVYWDEEWYLGS